MPDQSLLGDMLHALPTPDLPRLLQNRTPIIKLRERQSLPLAVRHQIFPRLREKQIRFPRSAQIAHAVARVEERWFLGVRDGQLRDGERVLADC